MTRTCGGQLLHIAHWVKTIRITSVDFPPPCPRDTDVSCSNGGRLDVRSLSPLEHVLVRSIAFSHETRRPEMAQSVVAGSAPGTDEQFAARELVRSWASGSGAIQAVRDVEQGHADAWRAPYE